MPASLNDMAASRLGFDLHRPGVRGEVHCGDHLLAKLVDCVSAAVGFNAIAVRELFGVAKTLWTIGDFVRIFRQYRRKFGGFSVS